MLSTYRLVDGYTDGSLGDVEHNAGATVVVLEGHALVDGGIHFNIDIISSLLLTIVWNDKGMRVRCLITMGIVMSCDNDQ